LLFGDYIFQQLFLVIDHLLSEILYVRLEIKIVDLWANVFSIAPYVTMEIPIICAILNTDFPFE
jgi:hypothetical protein